jgi:hypothetical protein
VVVLPGDTTCVPLMPGAALQPPLAVQVDAPVLDHVRVLVCPEAMDVGLAARVTVGGGTTVTVVDWLVVPPVPVQASV